MANSEQVELSGVEEASAIEMETANKKGGSNSPVRGIKVIKDERSKRTKKADEKLAEKKMSLRKSATGDQSNLAEKKVCIQNTWALFWQRCNTCHVLILMLNGSS